MKNEFAKVFNLTQFISFFDFAWLMSKGQTMLNALPLPYFILCRATKSSSLLSRLSSLY